MGKNAKEEGNINMRHQEAIMHFPYTFFAAFTPNQYTFLISICRYYYTEAPKPSTAHL